MKLTANVLKQNIQSNPIINSSNTFEGKKDIEIWKSFKKGDGKAFNYIYHQYFPLLFNYGCRFTQDKDLVKDAIQDLFIYLKVNRKKLGDTDSIKFYLFKALRRNIARKTSKKSELVYKDTSQLSHFDIVFSHETVLISREKQSEMKYHLNQAIQKLTERQKEAIVYFYYEGFNYEQIAGLMNFSKVEYARKLIYRAISTLKEHIESATEKSRKKT